MKFPKSVHPEGWLNHIEKGSDAAPATVFLRSIYTKPPNLACFSGVPRSFQSGNSSVSAFGLLRNR